MAVTLPVLLLILDFWPLGRFTSRSAARAALIEKLPLFVAAVIVAGVTFFAQQQSGSVSTLDAIGIGRRLQTAIVAVAAYASQTIWPTRLAVFYPFVPPPGWLVVITAGGLLGAFVAAFKVRHTRPWIFAGLTWFICLLLPVLGLVQVGLQAHADRYTYLPQIGLLIALTWTVADWFDRPASRRVLAAVATVVLAALILRTTDQLKTWRSSFSLFEHAVAVTPPNAVAHNGLALAYLEDGQTSRSLDHFRTAISIWPDYAEAHTGLAATLLKLGEAREAVSHLQAATNAKPEYPEAWVNLGVARLRLGDAAGAMAAYETAARLRPDHAPTRLALASALIRTGNVERAVQEAQRAKSLSAEPALRQAADDLLARASQPADGAGFVARGNEYAAAGKFAEAVAEYQQALVAGVRDPVLFANLGAALASAGNYDAAILALEEALRLKPDLPQVRENLDRARRLKAGR